MTDTYVVRVGDDESPIPSSEALDRYLAHAFAGEYSDFWVVQRGPAMKGLERLLYRALGLRADSDGRSVYVSKSPKGATVVFLDEDYNEKRVIDRNVVDDVGEIEFRLSNGQKITVPAVEVVSHDVALGAVKYFFQHGTFPPSLTYRGGRGRRRRRLSAQ